MISIRVGLLPLALLIGAGFASGASITFTESATATGSLGSNPFTNSLITLTASGDTSNVVDNGAAGFTLLPVTVSINIVSLTTTANLTDTAAVFSCQNCITAAVGIIDVDAVLGAFDVLDTVDNAFRGYALMTSIGPITGAIDFNTGRNFNTNLGLFEISSAGNATFTAAAGTSAPEPATVALFGLGLAGLAVLKRRKVNGENFRRGRRPGTVFGGAEIRDSPAGFIGSPVLPAPLRS